MTQEIVHADAWGIAAIVVALISWVLYRYLAPRTWREWASAGLVQAFIIALYAEMYGFPLTIYLLARFSGLDRAGLDANLWASARREGRLATRGLYGVVRHPQYLGLFIALFGEGVVHWPTLFSVALFPLIVLAYSLLALREERAVLASLGEEYQAYKARVPAFIPRTGLWRRFFGRRAAWETGMDDPR
jgi:protein-S-isoprenylcysteine O-methyltransferase Ste14